MRGAQTTRPKSAISRPKSPMPSSGAQTARTSSAVPNRFAPVVDASARRWRILSGRISAREKAGKYATTGASSGSSGGEEDDAMLDVYEDNDDADIVGEADALKEYEEGNSLRGVKTLEVGDKTLIQSIRKEILRPQKGGPVPFRFSSALPLSYKQEFYMELSSDDSEDEEGGGGNIGQRKRRNTIGGNNTTGGIGGGGTGGVAATTGGGDKPKPKPKSAGANKKGGGAVVKLLFKHEKPINYDRPKSGTLFREMAEADSEFKVMYRHTNFRRMPLTARQEKWLEDQEAQRVKLSYEVAKKLVENEALKAAKKKEKGDKDGKGKKDEKKDKKDDKKSKEAAAKAALLAAKAKPPPPKYKSATQFMQMHFPNFDGDDEEDRIESCGPMKITQMAEVERVCDAFGHAELPIKGRPVPSPIITKTTSRFSLICLYVTLTYSTIHSIDSCIFLHCCSSHRECSTKGFGNPSRSSRRCLHGRYKSHKFGRINAKSFTS